MQAEQLRRDARAIWDAAVAAADPAALIGRALADRHSLLMAALTAARRIIVVGGGKASAAMAAAVEAHLPEALGRMVGVVNVPAEAVRPLHAIRLHGARPAGSNQPTADGVVGTDEMLQLVAEADERDVVICLISGGGSALLPAPAVPLADKQAVTLQLHACGATINEMNAVRKHLSRIKGGGLAATCRAPLFCLIISDVVGDPLDVIASGPTAPDPTTFSECIAILRRYDLFDRVPVSVRQRLEDGAAGRIAETMKSLPPNIRNLVLGSNANSLAAAHDVAERLGYRTLNLGSYIEGETRHVATVAAGIVRSMIAHDQPVPSPACLLLGGETTVSLGPDSGKGGRNTEFVLAALLALTTTPPRYVVLSGGTDGEDGPTDAAGAVGDSGTLPRAVAAGCDPATALARHDSYNCLDRAGDLIRTGLTGTNVMDVRVVLVGSE